MQPTSDPMPATNSPATSSASLWLRRGGLLIALVAVVMVLRLLPINQWLDAVKTWVGGLGALGPFAYGLLYIVAALAFVPGSAITLAAGALFGTLVGTIVVSIASTLSAAIAFPLARTLLRSRIESKASESPSFRAIDGAIEDGGWKVVGLMRLSPVVPFSALNYMLGLTKVPYAPSILVSWIAMFPGTLLYVSLGAAGGNLAEGGKSTKEWALLGAGIVATIAVTVVLTRMAKARMAEHGVKADA